MKKTNVLFSSLLAIAALIPSLTTAETFAEKPTDLIVPFGAGVKSMCLRARSPR